MYRRKAEFTFISDKGLAVKVHQVQPGDAGYLVDLFDHLSADSRYLRFNQYLANPDPAMVRQEAEHLSAVAPQQGQAFLAFADLPDQPHAPVGGARYVLTGEAGTAEVSIVVRDDLQHQGIGAQLLRFLATEARNAGVRTLIGTFHTSNRRIWALLAESPYHSSTQIAGVQTTVTIDLETARATVERARVSP